MTVFLGIVIALRSAQDSPDWSKLVEELSSPEIAVRDCAVEQILAGWERWSHADLRRLEECARTSDPELATRAASALDRIRTRKALGRRLVEGMPDIDFSTDNGRWEAIASARDQWRTGLLSGGDLSKLMGLLRSLCGVSNPHRLTEFLEFGVQPASYAELVLPLLHHRDPEVRRGATITLADFDPQEHVAELALRLKDENREVRQAAAYTLAEMQAVDCADQIAELLSDSDPEVRSWALYALENLRARDCADRVARLLDSPSEAYPAASVLGELGAKAYAPKIVDLLRAEKDERSSPGYYTILGKMRAVEHADLLLPLRNGANAERAIHGWSVMGAHDYIPRILPFLTSKTSDLRYAAQGALCWLGAKESLPKLISSLSAPPLGAEARMAGILHWVAAKGQHEKVAFLLRDSRPTVRGYTAWALGLMGAGEYADAVAHLLGARATATWALRALGWMGSGRHKQAIADFLRKGNAKEIEAALDALAELEATEHIPDILPHLKSPDERVQKKASQTLQRLVGSLSADRREKQVGAILAALPEDWAEDSYTFGSLFLLFPDGAKNRRRILFKLVWDIEDNKWIQDALLQTYENQAYRKLTEPFVLPKPITSEADLVSLCEQHGLEINHPQLLRLEGCIVDGIRTSLLRLLERCWDKGPIAVNHGRVMLLTPPRAIRHWERRLEEDR